MPVSRRTLLSSLTLLSVCWLWPVAWPAAAQAQLPPNRCTGPAGNTIYTDRDCASIGANDRLPRGTASLAYRQRRGGCARNVQELIYEITSAVDSRDVNRLGAVYHWVGLNAASGDRILNRLQTLVDRPLVDIVAVRGAAPAPSPSAASPPAEGALGAGAASNPIAPAIAPNAARSTAQTTGTTSADTPETSAPTRSPSVRRAPVALRLQQTFGKGDTPSQTTLGLRRHLDCWWITL